MTEIRELELAVGGRRVTLYPVQPDPPGVRWRVRRDDELEETGYRMRPGYGGRMTPAVFRFGPQPLPRIGDFRVNVSSWEHVFLAMNDGDRQDLGMLSHPETGLMNKTGWPMLQYLVMSDNQLIGERTGKFLRFHTLRVTEPTWPVPAWAWQRFTVVRRLRDRVDIIDHPNRGRVYWPLVTNEGAGYIPLRYVAEVGA